MNTPQRLDVKTLDAIITALGHRPNERDCAQRLKSAWPMFRFIFCDDDDLGDKEPFWKGQYFSLHLMAAELGCATFTHEPANSIGVVVGILEE